MKKTAEQDRINKVSPATVELLIRERNKGKSLRQLGQMLGASHEQVRQILAKHSPSRVTLLAENTVAAKLGYPVTWLIKLRKEGIINPTKPGGHWNISLGKSPAISPPTKLRQPALVHELEVIPHCSFAQLDAEVLRSASNHAGTQRCLRTTKNL
jgi:transcriptional regulator with XRE-family HTH domain